LSTSSVPLTAHEYPSCKRFEHRATLANFQKSSSSRSKYLNDSSGTTLCGWACTKIESVLTFVQQKVGGPCLEEFLPNIDFPPKHANAIKRCKHLLKAVKLVPSPQAQSHTYKFVDFDPPLVLRSTTQLNLKTDNPRLQRGAFETLAHHQCQTVVNNTIKRIDKKAFDKLDRYDK
jgi:hypothetical protein